MSRFIAAGAPRSVRSVGGLSKEHPGSDPHVALHSTQGREVGAVGGWPEQGTPRLRAASRASFHPAARGRGGRWAAWASTAPARTRVSRLMPARPAWTWRAERGLAEDRAAAA